MNQQEILDHLWVTQIERRPDLHWKGVWCVLFSKDDLAQAAAEIRRQARQETLDEVAQMAKDAAEHASAAALKLHSEKKLLEGQKTVFRALYLHFTSFANRIENMSALAQPNGAEGER